MTDFERRFRNHAEHWDILRNLIDVIADHALASFSNTVSMEGYRRINRKYPLEEMFGKPYGIAASSAVRLAHHWRNHYLPLGKLLVFVEQGTHHHGDMVDCFRRDGLDDPIPVPKEHPAAQAADLYAWERGSYNNTLIRRPSLEYLKKKMPDGPRALDGKWENRAIRQALENLDVPPRREIPDGVNFAFNNTPKQIRKQTIK